MKKVLLLGLGDVAQRSVRFWPSDWRLFAASRHVDDATDLVHLNTPSALECAFELDLDVDLSEEIDGLAQVFDTVFYTVPPTLENDERDQRLARLLDFWAKRGLVPKQFIYVSTTGVYGDCAGAWIDESHGVNPISQRAQARVSAEQMLHEFSAQWGTQVVVLRAPGIYALERLPYRSVLANAPILLPQEDSFSNHIHADDLARAGVFFAMQAGARELFSVFNVCDDEPLLIGQWMSALAHILGRSDPPQLNRAQMQALVAPIRWSFMCESRKISNVRLKAAGFEFLYPSARDFLQANASAIRAYASLMVSE